MTVRSNNNSDNFFAGMIMMLLTVIGVVVVISLFIMACMTGFSVIAFILVGLVVTSVIDSMMKKIKTADTSVMLLVCMSLAIALGIYGITMQ